MTSRWSFFLLVGGKFSGKELFSLKAVEFWPSTMVEMIWSFDNSFNKSFCNELKLNRSSPPSLSLSESDDDTLTSLSRIEGDFGTILGYQIEYVDNLAGSNK